MHQITIHRQFRASHALRLPSGKFEPRHAHLWTVAITLEAKKLDAMECVIDFHLIEKWADDILAPARGKNLNTLPPFANASGQLIINPSAERVVQWIAEALKPRLPKRVKLLSVAVEEEPGCWAKYVLKRS